MRTQVNAHWMLLVIVLLASCESEDNRQRRLEREEQERLDREQKLELERKEREIYQKYITNSLRTGTTPYAYCYGSNENCTYGGCSEIKVKSPLNSDVLVTLKSGHRVVSHVFIKSGSSYTFEVPNGTYQPFFYYGKGWYPDKVMKQTSCGTLAGGFISDEFFGKDDPQRLFNQILEYELILQRSGNFSTRPSNANEAL